MVALRRALSRSGSGHSSRPDPWLRGRLHCRDSESKLDFAEVCGGGHARSRGASLYRCGCGAPCAETAAVGVRGRQARETEPPLDCSLLSSFKY